MECGDDMVADDEVRASHGGRRNQGLLWFFGASATLGVAAVTAITCAVFDTFQIDPWRYVTWVVPVMFLLYLAVLGIGRACFRKRQKDIRFPEEPSMTSSRPSYLA